MNQGSASAMYSFEKGFLTIGKRASFLATKEDTQMLLVRREIDDNDGSDSVANVSLKF